jgi:exopolysaccharide biosynthesis protein
MSSRRRLAAAFLLLLAASALWAADTVTTPFRGVTHVYRVETVPRDLHIHLVRIDLSAPGISVKLTPPSGPRETVRRTALDFLRQQRAQVAINAHFFLPFPSTRMDAWLVGFAASEGKVYSAFERPKQSFALVPYAPAIAIDRANHAAIVHRDPAYRDGKHVVEPVEVWTAVAGSAQIVTDGVRTIPTYGRGQLQRSRRHKFKAGTWYDVKTARTAMAISRDGRTLTLFTVDVKGGSKGMTVGEVADLLVAEGAWQALNLDGGGSTTLAMEDPETRQAAVVNTPSDKKGIRAVASSLAVFAQPARP